MGDAMPDKDIERLTEITARLYKTSTVRLGVSNKPKVEIKCSCGHAFKRIIPKNWGRYVKCPWCGWEFTFRIRRVK